MAWIKEGDKFMTLGGLRWEAVEDSSDVDQLVIAKCIDPLVMDGITGNRTLMYSEVAAFVCVRDGKTMTVSVD